MFLPFARASYSSFGSLKSRFPGSYSEGKKLCSPTAAAASVLMLLTNGTNSITEKREREEIDKQRKSGITLRWSSL